MYGRTCDPFPTTLCDPSDGDPVSLGFVCEGSRTLGGRTLVIVTVIGPWLVVDLVSCKHTQDSRPIGKGTTTVTTTVHCGSTVGLHTGGLDLSEDGSHRRRLSLG